MRMISCRSSGIAVRFGFGALAGSWTKMATMSLAMVSGYVNAQYYHDTSVLSMEDIGS